MNLIRLILIALTAWLVWRLILQPRFQARRNSGQSPPAAKSQQMVRCRRCSVHIPFADALKQGSHYYCSAQCQHEDTTG